MKKIENGDENLRLTQTERSHKDLEKSSLKFLNALEIYKTTQDAGQKEQLKQIMDQQLALIRSAVNGLKDKPGIGKEEIRVEKDYQQFVQSGSEESYAALEHDLITLRDYNRLSEK